LAQSSSTTPAQIPAHIPAQILVYVATLIPVHIPNLNLLYISSYKIKWTYFIIYLKKQLVSILFIETICFSFKIK
jgi:hypothetical protein